MILGLDLSEKRTQSIVSVGNPDTATHVGVFTPGLTSNVVGMKNYDTQMDQLRAVSGEALFRHGDAAGIEQGVEQVATITWMNYQSPQLTLDSVGDLDGDSVLETNSAQAGGDRLARFHQGLQSARDDGVNVTALGHSYGSTTTGYALQQTTGVDRVAFYGSPGLSVDDVEDLKVRSGNVFYAEADGDGIGDLAKFGKDPSEMPGITYLSTDKATVNGEELSGVRLHSDYMLEESTIQYNLGVLVAGYPEDAITGRSNLPLGEAYRARPDLGRMVEKPFGVFGR
nr:alpha/beta hydrolase [Kineosporia babensis]